MLVAALTEDALKTGEGLVAALSVRIDSLDSIWYLVRYLTNYLDMNSLIHLPHSSTTPAFTKQTVCQTRIEPELVKALSTA